MAIQLCEGVDSKQEDGAARFLGVHIEHDPSTGFLKMKQKGLIKRVLQILGLDVGTANGMLTPAKVKPLAKHVHGEPASSNSTTVVWLECFCILLVTLPLIILTLSTVPQDICSSQS